MSTEPKALPEDVRRISLDSWRKLCAIGRERSFPAGSRMLRQGDPGLHLLALTQGLVKVIRREEDGETTLLAFRGVGDLLGEGSAFDLRQLRIADVVALRPCKAVVLERKKFRDFVESENLVLEVMQQTLARLRESDLRRAELMTLPLPARLARALVRLVRLNSAAADTEPLVLTGLTQEELAQYIGVSRSAVVTGLQQLRDVGAIETARRAVTIRDLTVLHTWAREPVGDL